MKKYPPVKLAKDGKKEKYKRKTKTDF